MKALSIQQPWAWAILHAGKPVENRSWWTKYRGPFFIHASKKFDAEGYIWIKNHQHRLGYREEIPAMNDSKAFPVGAIVGITACVDCVKQHASPWFFGEYGFVLRDTLVIEPIVPLKGQLGFFDVDQYITERALEFMKEISCTEILSL